MADLARQARGDILSMTTLAGSGHPGGSLSSIDILIVLWSCANVSPETLDDPGRDRIVVSHGHTAPAVYGALGRTGFFDPLQAVCGFRSPGSPFEGHADPKVPGVEWECGNLGQGLSAACGMALASRLTGTSYGVYCVMGDGEQQKGQIAEARRFAVKYRLDNLAAIIDCNNLQAMGSVEDTMPQDLAAEWQVAGWNVEHADGHDHASIYQALHRAQSLPERPTVILAQTVMGKGVVFIEDLHEYHGKVLTRDECERALSELQLADAAPSAAETVSPPRRSGNSESIELIVRKGTPRSYETDTDCRSAFGNALVDLARENDGVPMAVFDCDLAASVKTDDFAKARQDSFFQCGIQEHSTATIAGAMSKCGVLSFFADFGVFGISETYNQHRLNDINATSLKLICTHCGLDVGEDGKTHQCIDYIGLAANLFGFKLIVPADANQTDRIIRYVATTPGRFLVAMGRSKVPVITDGDGQPAYVGDYVFEYGRADWVRHGRDAVIVACGTTVSMAVTVSDMLAAEGYESGVLDLSCPLELDEEAIRTAAATGLIATYEDHNVRTGIGSIIGAFLSENGLDCRFARFGVSQYGGSGSPGDNYRLQKLDPESVAQSVASRLKNSA